jgi:hypothetical protein
MCATLPPPRGKICQKWYQVVYMGVSRIEYNRCQSVELGCSDDLLYLSYQSYTLDSVIYIVIAVVVVVAAIYI